MTIEKTSSTQTILQLELHPTVKDICYIGRVGRLITCLDLHHRSTDIKVRFNGSINLLNSEMFKQNQNKAKCTDEIIVKFYFN